jgi:acetyltransferase (GNAT) family protein
MKKLEKLTIRTYRPKDTDPHSSESKQLEGAVSNILISTSRDDLYKRFIGIPYIPYVLDEIFGRMQDKSLIPDYVVVASRGEEPVGYGQRNETNLAILIRSDKKHQRIGRAIFQEHVEEARKSGIRKLKAFVLRENEPMRKAFEKWNEKTPGVSVTPKTNFEEVVEYEIDVQATRESSSSRRGQ